MDASQSPSQRAHTTDISKSGLRVISDLPAAIGTPVEIFVKMPEEVMDGPAHEWCCRGRVVRVSEPDPVDHIRAFAVKIHYYEVLQSSAETAGRAQ